MDLTKSSFSPFVLINPIEAIPSFIDLTESQTDEEKRRTIKVASISVTTMIGLLALLGEQIISLFGFSVGSLQVGGGIVMIMIVLNVLNVQTNRTKATPEEEDGTSARANITIVPLTIPLLTDPGSISTVIVYADKTRYQWGLLLLAGVGMAIVAVVWVVLRAIEPITRVIGRTGINVSTRLMGLILTAPAVGFIVDGLKTLLSVLRA